MVGLEFAICVAEYELLAHGILLENPLFSLAEIRIRARFMRIDRHINPQHYENSRVPSVILRRELLIAKHSPNNVPALSVVSQSGEMNGNQKIPRIRNLLYPRVLAELLLCILGGYGF